MTLAFIFFIFSRIFINDEKDDIKSRLEIAELWLSGSAYIPGDMWTHAINIGDYKRVLIYDNLENDPGLNARITYNDQEYFWSLGMDGHIYFNGSRVI